MKAKTSGLSRECHLSLMTHFCADKTANDLQHRAIHVSALEQSYISLLKQPSASKSKQTGLETTFFKIFG